MPLFLIAALIAATAVSLSAGFSVGVAHAQCATILVATEGYESAYAITFDGDDGYVTAFRRQPELAGSPFDILLKRIDRNGNNLWPAYPDGRSIMQSTEGLSLTALEFDGSELTVLIEEWQGINTLALHAMRVRLSDGGILWQRPIAASVPPERDPRAALDVFQGGIFVTWVDGANADIYAQKLSLSGTPLWGPGGVLAHSAGTSVQHYPQIVGDRDHGAIVVWEDLRSGTSDIYAQRFDLTGARQWGDAGLAICSAPQEQNRPLLARYDQPLLEDDYYIVWEDHRNPTVDIYGFKIDVGGNNLWNQTNGRALAASSTSNQENPRAVAGPDGLVIAVQDDVAGNDDIRAKMVAPDGSFPWGSASVPVCTDPSDQNFSEPPLLSWYDGLDHVVGGDFLVYWTDDRGADHAQLLAREDGNPVWVSNGVPVCTSAFSRVATSVWGAMAIWSAGTDGDVFVTSLPLDPVADVSGHALNTVTGQLAPMPENFAVGCPQGDADHLLVRVRFEGIRHEIPASKISLGATVNANVELFWTSAPTADQDVTAFGNHTTTLTQEFLGGCGEDSVEVLLDGMPIGRAAIQVRSVDPIPNGTVDLSDMSQFATAYGKCEGSPGFDSCFDYSQTATPSCVDLTDLSVFAWHFGPPGHSFPGGSSKPGGRRRAMSRAELGLVSREVGRGVRTELSLTGLGGPLFLAASLRAPRHWELGRFVPAEGFAGQVILLPRGEDSRTLSLIAWSDADTRASADEVIRLGEILASPANGSGTPAADATPTLVYGEVLNPGGQVQQIRGKASAGGRPGDAGSLEQNTPNPFSPSTTIRYSVRHAGVVRLVVFNVSGRVVRTLIHGFQERGEYSADWDGRDDHGNDVAGGIYFYRLQSEASVVTRKMLLVR